MISLEILQPLDGGELLEGFADRPFLNPGALRLTAGRKAPKWLPAAPGCLYADAEGDLYESASVEGRAARKVGDLAGLVLGRDLLGRFDATGQAGFVFRTGEPGALAACLQDDTEVDLPLDKALRLLAEGRRIHLTRNVLHYALLEAVRAIGRANARRSAPGDDPWTMRRVFGTVG